MTSPRHAISLIAVVCCLAGCRQKQPSLRVPAQAPPHAGLTAMLVKTDTLWVEIVSDPASRAQGLMDRRDLPEDEGMLFVFEYPQPLSFWMRNTYLPLDIAFVSPDRRIENILPMKPLDEGPRYESRGPALYAIEANQGWFARHGIKAGDKIQL